MNIYYSVSYVLPVRISNLDRQVNLNRVVEWLLSSSLDIEIIVVEMDSVKRLNFSKLSPLIHHVFIEDTGVFNRGLARNIGALKASSNKICFGDIDIVFDYETLESSIDNCTKGKVVSPWSTLVDIRHHDLELFLKGGNSVDDLYQCNSLLLNYFSHEVKFINCHSSLASGNIFMHKNDFYKIGGWPTNLTGWGGEDDIFGYICYRFFDTVILKNKGFHFPHERIDTDTKHHSHYTDNVETMKYILYLNDFELIDYVEENRVLLHDALELLKMNNDSIPLTRVPLIKDNEVMARGYYLL